MSTIAQGIELDQQRVASDGLALLVDASDTAKLVVRSPVYPNLVRTHNGAERVSLVGDSLAYLAALSPPARVSKVAVRRAKQPWERSIIAEARRSGASDLFRGEAPWQGWRRWSQTFQICAV